MRHGSPDHHPLGDQGAGQREAEGLLVGRVAEVAPRAVFAAVVRSVGLIEVSAAGADAEPGGRTLLARDLQRRGVGGPTAHVEPANREPVDVLDAEPVVADVPLLTHLGRVDVGRHHRREGATVPVFGVIADASLVAPHAGRDPAKRDDVEVLAGVGDRLIPAPETASDFFPFAAEIEIDRVPAFGAERPGADGGSVVAQVDRIDGDLPALGVEGGARSEVAERVLAAALEAVLLGAELLSLRIDPAHLDVQVTESSMRV